VKGAGKQFERQLRDALRRDWPGAYIERFTDGMTGQGKFSVKSPPDLIAVGIGSSSLLIEAKATKGTSIAFDRVDEHQLDHLQRFRRATHDSTHGIVALLQYNGKLGGERVYRGWLVPVWFWDGLSRTLGRKSLPFNLPDLDRYEMRWVPGHGFVTTDALAAFGVRPTRPA
jgi:Holliday junction resolvase